MSLYKFSYNSVHFCIWQNRINSSVEIIRFIMSTELFAQISRVNLPASAIQEVKETSAAAAPPTTAPETKKGYTYSSLPSLTGGPKRKIYKQPKKR